MRRLLTRRRHALAPEDLGAGIVLSGQLWCGDGTEHARGRVLIDATGTLAAFGPADQVDVPFGCAEIEGAWVGPGLRDAHVHLAFGAPAEIVSRGVVAVRDLGAPPQDAMAWRQLAVPRVEVAGPLLTAPGGYPSRSWGRNGFAAFVDDPDQAHRLVTGLAPQVDIVKLALEPRGGPLPDQATCAAVVAAAHAQGREVSCHALTTATVEQGLDAGVDELAHTPTEPLATALVERIAAAGVCVVSTLHTVSASGDGAAAIANARAFAAAGVTIRYGTDLGNTGISPGADAHELRLLSDDVGLGAERTLMAATVPLQAGDPAGVVVLDVDPRDRPETWRDPRAVIVGQTLLRRP